MPNQVTRAETRNAAEPRGGSHGKTEILVGRYRRMGRKPRQGLCPMRPSRAGGHLRTSQRAASGQPPRTVRLGPREPGSGRTACSPRTGHSGCCLQSPFSFGAGGAGCGMSLGEADQSREALGPDARGRLSHCAMLSREREAADRQPPEEVPAGMAEGQGTDRRGRPGRALPVAGHLPRESARAGHACCRHVDVLQRIQPRGVGDGAGWRPRGAGQGPDPGPGRGRGGRLLPEWSSSFARGGPCRPGPARGEQQMASIRDRCVRKRGTGYGNPQQNPRGDHIQGR